MPDDEGDYTNGQYLRQGDFVENGNDVRRDLVVATQCTDVIVERATNIRVSRKSTLMNPNKAKQKEILGAAKDGVLGLINLLFGILEDELGKTFVSTALGLITVSKEGLHSKEIEDIISSDDELLDDIFTGEPSLFYVSVGSELARFECNSSFL
jgi:hypothetical protein